jgi:hypothetical protein
MSWIKAWIWPSSSTPEAEPIGNVISEGIDNIDNLIAKRMQMLKKSNDLLREAKECQRTNRPRAITLMKQKQEYDRQAASYEGMIANLEKTNMALDSAATSAQLAKNMQQSSISIKNVLSGTSVAEIEGIADDLDDTMHEVGALSDALSRPMGGGAYVDEDELLAQLDNEPPPKKVEQKEVELPSLPKKVEEVKKVEQKGVAEIIQ